MARGLLLRIVRNSDMDQSRSLATGAWGDLLAEPGQDFLSDVEAGVIDDDLAKALASYPMAQKNFDGFPPSSKRLILEWIAQAKRPETRARRIADTVKKANDNLRANHFRQ